MLRRNISTPPKLLVALAALCLAGQAHAQALACTPPRVIPAPRPAGPSLGEPARPGPVGAYTLALSWSPQYCRSASSPAAFQCGGAGARFGFVLHGLWPDGKGPVWPQYCRSAEILPRATIRQMLCTTPSADLIQHEWAKHGTCSGMTPEAYFAEARRLFATIRFPDMTALSRRPDLTVGDFVRAFAMANPALPPGAIRVRITRDKWLDEVWLCLDRDRRFARCARTQASGYAWPLRLKIWRGAA